MTPPLACVWLGLQTLLTCEVAGPEPVRFGVPLPVDALARGLHLEGEPGAVMQWAPLQSNPGFGEDRVWVEICVVGARGRLRLAAGGVGPEKMQGACCQLTGGQSQQDGAEEQWQRREWIDAAVDELRRRRWTRPDPVSGQAAGEAETEVSDDWLGRRTRVAIPVRWLRSAGVLPTRQRARADPFRDELLATVARLPEAPGRRGRGDYMRGEVVTNLEFDTVLGFVQLGLREESEELLRRAWYSARHLVDRDLDLRSGLPFVHGRDHRLAHPEAGHVWIRGLLLVGCCFADRDLIDAARAMARALAARVTAGSAAQGRHDRLRDEAWPLWELESYLRFEDLPPVRDAADRLGQRMVERWDPALRVLRYGEGQLRGGYFRERLWLSVGIAVPALRMYAERSGDPRATAIIQSLQGRATTLLGTGADGIPLQLVLGPSGVVRQTRRVGAAEAFILFEGLEPKQRARWLPRVGKALRGVLDDEPPDLATRWTMMARCGWLMR